LAHQTSSILLKDSTFALPWIAQLSADFTNSFREIRESKPVGELLRKH
jgi:hypothetical protein